MRCSCPKSLTALGHQVVLHAPDAKGTGFFRSPACGAVGIRVEPAPDGMVEMVEQRIAEYLRYFEDPACRDFDIFHAHDGISGNALATLKQRGMISGFARTVHHIDSFSDPRLMALQERSIEQADVFFTVSGLWQRTLRQTRGLASSVVGNGVDLTRFSSATKEDAQILRQKWKIPAGPVLVAIGGIEERKNTVRMVEAFRQMRAVHPDAQFVVAGGASLLDHRGYQGEFRAMLATLGDDAGGVRILGTVDDGDMPALYRMADALVFASINEGFGLVVLEAMASGLPVVVSSIAPFDEFLAPDDAIWCDPYNPASIAEAMMVSLMPPIRRKLIPRGHAVAARHSWQRTADAHLGAYAKLMELADA